MEIKITTNMVLKVLQLLSWVIFIGLCIEAGGIAVNTFMSLFIFHHADNFWEGSVYLARLYQFASNHFVVVTITIVIVAVLKATMFYLIVKLFTDKKLNMAQPFNRELGRFIANLSYLAFCIGLFCYCGAKFTAWLATEGMEKADLQGLHIAGADVWLFMGVVLFVIVHIVKKGIEIQNENDLTV